MATAKVTAMELRLGDEVMMYIYNDRGTCVRIVTLRNLGGRVEVIENGHTSKMPFVFEHNQDDYIEA